MASDCSHSHWNEIKAHPSKCNYKSGTEGYISRQRSLKRKIEGRNVKCINSCSENVISGEDNEVPAAEDVISKDVPRGQPYQQRTTFSKDSTPQPSEEVRKFTCSGEIRTNYLSETSREHVNGRAYVSLRLSTENEEFNSLGSNATVNDISPKKMFIEKKKGPVRSVSDAESWSRTHMMTLENEMLTLREALRSQHQALQDLYAELEEERNASSTAANEALSMIVRLQEEKAAMRMESNQYKRLVEEKIAHDQESLAQFEEAMYRKNEEIVSLEHELQAYRHRLLSIGLDDLEMGKIRWPAWSHPNDNPNERYGDSDQWQISYAENFEQEGFDSYDTLGWKTSNNSRDLWEIQDKKGKRHIYKDDSMCLDDMWNHETKTVDSYRPLQWEEACSMGVPHGQDRISGNSNRIQWEEYPTSRKMMKDSIRGCPNKRGDGFASQRMDFECQIQHSFENLDEEHGLTTCQSNTPEMTMNTPEDSLQESNLTLWERIEKLEDRLQQLSRRRGHNCHLDEEWISTNMELQKTVAAYTASLKEGARSHWRLSLDNNGICDELIEESGVRSAEDLQFSKVHEKDKEMAGLAKNDSEVHFSEKNDTNLKVIGDESDANKNLKAAGIESDASFNVHDVYVVQQDSETNKGFNCHKGQALDFDLEDEDRLGKPDPLPQIHQGNRPSLDSSLTEGNLLQCPPHNANISEASDSVYNAGSGVLPEAMIDTSSVQEEVKQLNMRLQTLEEDREFMKQTIHSLKREREELSLLKDIAQQLRELKTPSKSFKVVKSRPQEEDASVTSFMKGFISFNKRSRMHRNMGDGSHDKVGLSNLLEKTPLRRIPYHITRVVKVSSFTEVRSVRQDKASEAVLVIKQTIH